MAILTITLPTTRLRSSSRNTMSKASSKPSKKRFASSSFFSFLSDSKAHKNTRGVLRCAQVCFAADLLACSLPCGQMDKVDKVFHREEFSCSVEFNKVCSTTGPRIHPPPPSTHTHTRTHTHTQTHTHTHVCSCKKSAGMGPQCGQVT